MYDTKYALSGYSEREESENERSAPRAPNMPNVQQLAGRGREGPGTEGCRIFKLRGDPSRKLDEGEGLGITDGGGVSRRSLAGKVLQNQ